MPTSADIRAVAEFVASRHGVFTRSQASELGMTKDDIARLVRDGLVAPYSRSVLRFTTNDVTWQQTAFAATVAGHAAASRAVAAALHKLDGADHSPALDKVSVEVPYGSTFRMPGVLVHRTRDFDTSDITTVDGIRCTTVARTIVDLAGDSSVSTDDLIRMIDDAQRRKMSMLWLLQTAERLRRRGREGPSRVIAIVERRLGGYRVPASWFERLLKRCLQSPILGEIEREYVLRDEAGQYIARFDLAVAWLRLGIEGHSRSFHLGEGAEQYDEDRDLQAAAEGWEIAYLGFSATKSPQAVCATIERIATRRQLDLGLSPARSGSASAAT